MINGLGSVVKAIKGNLDANDAEKLEEEIRKMREEEDKLRESINSQERTGNKVSFMFKNLTKYINEEQSRVNAFINKYNNAISKSFVEEDRRIYRLEYIDRISLTIDMLGLNLNDVTESLLLAKLGVISRFLFDKKETDKCVQELERQGIRLVSDEHMYEFLELSAIMNNTDIIFSIKLPLFKKEIFTFRRLIPLPMNGSEFVITPNYVAIHGNEILYYKEKCQLVRNMYICKNDQCISQINSKCIRKLLSGQKAECETKDVGLLTTIFEPEAGYIVAFNGKNVKLQTDCGVDKTLNGSVLIRFINCKVMVNNVQYEAEEGLRTVKLGLDIPRIETVKRNRTTQELGIHELRVEDLETKVQISRMQWGTTIHTTTTYTMLGVLTIVIVIVSYFPKKTTIFKPEVTPRPTFTPAIAVLL